MKAATKIRLDRCFGVLILWPMNLAARVLGRILRRDHTILPHSVRTIVVAKFAGMGSIIQTTPLLRALKERFPEARIIFVTAIGNRELLDRLDAVDKALCVDDSGLMSLMFTSCRILAHLIRLRVDLYFDLEVYSAYGDWMALCSLARNRLGLFRYSAQFKKGTYTHLVYFNTRMPVRKIYLQLGAVAGAVAKDSETERVSVRLHQSDGPKLSAKLTYLGFPEGKIPGRYVVVNPNASDLLLERRWPPDYFRKVIGDLLSHRVYVVLIGAPDEEEYVSDLLRGLDAVNPKLLVNTAARLELGELLALIQGSDCILTNDTGPFHMAVALNRPVVGIFGPAHPAHCGSDRSNVINLYRPVYCSPCLHELDEPACGGNNVCVKSIQPEMAVRAVEHLISASEQAGGVACSVGVSDAEPSITYRDLAGRPLGMIVRSSVPVMRVQSAEDDELTS